MPCREALDALDMLRALRTRLEREEDEPGVLDAFTRAVRDGAPLEDECPRDGDDPLAVVAAVARHVSELSAEWAVDVGMEGGTSQCRFATLGGVRRIGPEDGGGSLRRSVDRILVLRGDVLAATERARGAGWLVSPESGPYASAPAVEVEVVTAGSAGGAIVAYLVVRASDGWRVLDSRIVGQLCR